MQRPTAVSAFGILNIFIGAAGILGSLWTVALFSTKDASANPAMKVMLESVAYMRWLKISGPIWVIASTILVWSGVGLLRLKPWARKTCIGYVMCAIFIIIVGIPINYIFVVRPILEAARELQRPESFEMIGGAIGAGIGALSGWIYPALLWIFMTRPNVVAAFQTPPPLPSNVS